MKKTKQEIIAVRADETLLEAMKGISNRSEFIRQAILAALNNMCPFCKGTGIMSPNQKKHWVDLANDHIFIECDKCGEPRLACRHRSGASPMTTSPAASG